MDFMKILDQTVRDIKREVNLRVLNVPEIEQKVLDATSDEPWGPHGSTLLEIAEASKKYVDCQMVMNVLWQRLSDKNSNWRHFYKALAVIEYLIANGSQRAVDDIYDNISQISALERYEHVEPNLKDSGLNVRKKAETILSILDNRDKLQQVREKAASTRDKYIGLSSKGMSYKSSRISYDDDKYKYSDEYKSDTNQSSKTNLFRDDNKDPKAHKNRKNTRNTTEMVKRESRVNKDDYDDDFDPRASSPTNGNTSSKKVDLIAPNLMDDMINLPNSQVDLFADSNFPSVTTSTQSKTDLLGSKPSEENSHISRNTIAENSDPFASIQLNSFDQISQNESEFGAFTSNNESPKITEMRKGEIQVKSGIWADSLSRGLIDLNITSPKKISLGDQKAKSFKKQPSLDTSNQKIK